MLRPLLRTTKILLGLLCLKLPLASMAFEVPSYFTYQGRLLNSSGTTPLNAVVDIKFQIYNPANTCLLYEEIHGGVDLTLSSGIFSLKVGSPLGSTSRTANDPGLTMAHIFANTSSVIRASDAGTTNTCPGGYTAANGDTRNLRVTVIEGGVETVLTPDQIIAAQPYATVAQSLQGITPNGFIRANSAVSLTQSNAELLVSGNDASTLHHHDSLYVKAGGTSNVNMGTGGMYTTGRIGVGTSSPATDIEIERTNPTFRMDAASGGGGSSQVQFYSGVTERARIESPEASSELRFYTNGVAAITIDANQNTTFTSNMFVRGFLDLGDYTNAQEGTLSTYLSTCGANCSGSMWFNTDLGKIRYWTGSAMANLGDISGSHTAGGVAYSNGTSLLVSAAGSSGEVLVSSGTGAPTWAVLDDTTKLSLDGSDTMTGNLQMGGQTITGLATPVAGSDAATKSYVDSVAGAVSSAVAGDFVAQDGSTPLTANWNVGGFDLNNLGNISISAQKTLGVGHLTNAQESTLTAGFTTAHIGKVWYNTDLNQLRLWTGSTAQSLGIVGGSLSSLNGETGSAQTLSIATGAAVTAPTWNSNTNNHELQFPNSSDAGVAAGLLSKTDYDSFAAKQDGDPQLTDIAAIDPIATNGSYIYSDGTNLTTRTVANLKTDLGLGSMADETATDYLLRDGSLSMTGALNLAGNNITNVNSITGTSAVLGNITLSSGTASGTTAVFGDVTISSGIVTNLSTPTNSADAANKAYVDAAVGAVSSSASGDYVARDGSTTLTGHWNVGGYVLSNATLEALSGSAATPSLSFDGDEDTGIFSPGANTIAMSAGGVRQVTVNSNGFGIGTDSPIVPLHVSAEGAGSNALFDRYGSSPILTFRGAQGTAASPAATQINDPLFVLGARGHTGSGFSGANRASIMASASENWTTSANGTYLAFNTTEAGSLVLRERVRIDSNGNVGIGSSDYDPDGGGAAKLWVHETGDKNAQIMIAADYATRVTDFQMRSEPDGSGPKLRLFQGGDSHPSVANDLNFVFRNSAGTSGFIMDESGRIRFGAAIASEVALSILPAANTDLTIDTSGNIGVGTISPGTKLQVAGTLQVGDGGEICSGGNFIGAIRYNGGLQFCNGTSWQTLGVSGSGVQSLGGQTGNTQTLSVATGAAVTAPTWNSATDNHELQFPNSSDAGVAAGLLSKTDYDSFAAKQDGDAQLTDIAAINPATTSGQYLYSDGTNLTTRTVANLKTDLGLGSMADETATDYLLRDGSLSMTGALNMEGHLIRNLATPVASTDATTKAYVDAAVGSASGNYVNIDGTSTMTGNLNLGGNYLSGDGDSEGIFVSTAGNIGVGTTTPGSRFHMVSDGVQSELMNHSFGSNIPKFIARRARGTMASPLIIQDTDTALDLTAEGHDGSNYRAAARIQMQIDGTPGTNDMPGRMLFATTADGASSPTERMRITSEGNVGIGASAPIEALVIARASSSIRPPRILLTDTQMLGGIHDLDGSADYGLAISPDLRTVGNGAVYFSAHTGGGDGTSPYMIFRGGHGSAEHGHSREIMALNTSNGHVGIGVNSPTQRLEVGGSIKLTGAGTGITFNDGSTMTSASTGSASSLSNATDVLVQADSDVNGTGSILLRTGSTDRLIVNNDGNVGIGTTSPYHKFEVVQADADAHAAVINTSSTAARYPGMFVQNFTGGNGGSPTFTGFASRGSQGSPAAVQSGDSLFMLNGLGQTDTSTGYGTGALIQMQAAQNFSPTAHGTNISFSTVANNQTSLNTRMMITHDGNVGIGTATPQEKLDVNGNILSRMTNGSNWNYAFGASDGNGLFLGALNGNTSTVTDRAHMFYVNKAGDAHSYRLFRASTGTEAVQLNSNGNSYFVGGNVGIGTTTPSSKLDVVSGVMKVRDGTRGGYISNDANDGGRSYLVLDMDESDGLGSGGDYIYLAQSGNAGYLTSAGGLPLHIGSGGTQITMLTSGNVGVGTANPADTLHVAGDVRVGTGTTGCMKDADGTIIAGTCSSDIRFKKDVEPLGSQLEHISQLRPVTYKWRSEEFPEKAFGRETETGLIAQEVQQVLPELVAEDEEGYLKVRFTELNIYILQAVKDLYNRLLDVESHQTDQDRRIASKADKADVEAQLKAKDQRIQKLEQENAEMKARLDKIEKMLESK